jgi:predicted ester cyclase
MSLAKKNRQLARTYYGRVMNRAEVAAIPQILNEDFTFTIPTHPEVYRGVEGFTEEVTGLHGAFPDVHLDVHHLWCFDDLILGLWTGTGTNTGTKPLSTPAGPLPATGRPFVIQGVSWIAADGVLLRENLANEDTLKIIHDLGVLDCSDLYRHADASLVSGLQFPVGAGSGPLSGMVDSINLFNHPLLLESSTSPTQVQSFLATYWSAFANVTTTITQAKRSEEVIAYRWTFEADHVGSFFGIPASNKRIHHQGVTICILDRYGAVRSVYINENLIVLLPQLRGG